MTAAVTVTIAGEAFEEVVRVMVERDLENIASTFEVTIVDEARLRAALIAQIGLPSQHAPVKPGDSIQIAIDDEPVLVGWVEWMRFEWAGDVLSCHIRGRDKVGDLVECAALPEGPDEFHNVDLEQVAKQVCDKFGVGVKKQVDIGAPFPRLAKHRHMTALAFLESAARQRSVLLVSDGVGNLLLTRGGATRAPADLEIGGNIQRVDAAYDWARRFSDYFVTQSYDRHRGGAPALTHDDDPTEGGDDPPNHPATRTAQEQPAIGTMGHAIDPEVTRWRPTVRYTRSQSGMSSVQEQAEWMARVAKGQSDRVLFTVLGFRGGQKDELWRPNALVRVWEPYSGIDRDMLIAGIVYTYDDRTGAETRLRLAGRSAYDRINEAERGKHKRGGRRAHGGLRDPGFTDADLRGE